MRLQLRQQETPYGAETSHCSFEKPLVATSRALDTFGDGVIHTCYLELQQLAREQQGLEYLQVFVDVDDPDRTLWFIEDAQVVTALLPSYY